MKVLKAYPPNYPQMTRHFPQIKGKPGILFAYGDTIYNPSNVPLQPWIIAHEEVHGLRQVSDTLAWWDKYLVDAKFRYDEELLAHREEYRVFVERMGDPQGYYLDLVAKRLSSQLYGSIVSYDEAKRKIQET